MNAADTVKRWIQGKLWDYFWHNYQIPEIQPAELAVPVAHHEPQFHENICMPPYLGHAKFDDYSFLISVVKTRAAKTILELGTAHGNTVANICAESQARIFTVNALPEQMEGSVITFSLEREQIGLVYRQHGFQDRVVQLYANTRSMDLSRWVPPRSVDLAIVDACHDPEFVVNDFIQVLPTLRPAALVLLHDTDPSAEGYLLDSYLGCMYLRKMGFNVKHVSGTSWGVWRADAPGFSRSAADLTRNALHTASGVLLFGGRDGFIQALRWFASGFMRGKFGSRVSA